MAETPDPICGVCEQDSPLGEQRRIIIFDRSDEQIEFHTAICPDCFTKIESLFSELEPVMDNAPEPGTPEGDEYWAPDGCPTGEGKE